MKETIEWFCPRDKLPEFKSNTPEFISKTILFKVGKTVYGGYLSTKTPLLLGGRFPKYEHVLFFSYKDPYKEDNAFKPDEVERWTYLPQGETPHEQRDNNT